MSSRSPWHFGKATNKFSVEAPAPNALSTGEVFSTTRSSTPSTHKSIRSKFKFLSVLSSAIANKGHVSPPTSLSVQKVQLAGDESPLPQSLVSLPIERSFNQVSDEARARKIEIYDKGLVAVDLLQKLAGMTGPGCPNPVVPVLQILTGILKQLQVSHPHVE